VIASAFAGSGEAQVIDPPDDAPSNVSLYLQPGNQVGLQWTNTVFLAETEIGFRADNTGTLEPTSVITKVAYGVTGYSTGEDATTGDVCTWWVRHRKGGVSSAWVKAALGSLSCGVEI